MCNLIGAEGATSSSKEARAARRVQPTRRRKAMLIPGLMFALATVTAYAETGSRPQFTNVADSTSGFSSFGTMPAISDSGAVAFIAGGTNFGEGVFRWQRGRFEMLGSRTPGGLVNFGDDVAINCRDVVAFDATLVNTPQRDIFTSDGHTITSIVDSKQQQLIGGPFLGLGAMNCAGTVVFTGVRVGFQSQAIFAGNGGPLDVLEDTLNSNFSSFGNVDINDSGEVAFHGFPNDGSEGIFAGPGGSIDIVDTNNPVFGFGFLDPVIDNSGVVATAASLNSGGVEVVTGTGRRLSVRTDPAGPLTFIDNVSINNQGTLVFFADDASGGQALYVEGRESKTPAPFVKSGDLLFGSVVTGLKNGRFSVNDRNEVVFEYSLQDGRSGIAVARLGEVE